MKPESAKDARSELERAVRSGFAPGLVGLIARGTEVDVMPLGRMAIGGPPMRRDTIFRIASMSKPITAAAVMMLIDDGKLRLDDPVDRFLPELANRRVLRRLDGPIDDTVPAKRPVTVEDLLSFRLGWGFVVAPSGEYPIQRAIADLGIVGFVAARPRDAVRRRRMDATARHLPAVRPAGQGLVLHRRIRHPGGIDRACVGARSCRRFSASASSARSA